MAFHDTQEADLRNRIIESLKKTGNSNLATLLWKGYVTGIYFDTPEGQFKPKELYEFSDMLPSDGDEEQHIIFVYPMTRDERQEILENYRKEKRRKGRAQ